MNFKLSLSFIFSLILLVACNQPQPGTDAEDSTNPFFQKAEQFEAGQNYLAAVQEYENALKANPSVVRAHMLMGLLYADKLADPVGAMYHLQKYLQARPTAEDAEQMKAYLEKLRIDFVLSIPNSPFHNVEEFARISKENLELRQNLANLQRQLAEKGDELASAKVTLSNVHTAAASLPANVTRRETVSPAPATQPVDPNAQTMATTAEQPVATEPATPSVGDREHIIARGDSLWKIAAKYYPGEAAEGVEKIKAANPEATSNERNLKLGTRLVIPE
jgi:tetratricopeptide (TPR) repeat protein